MKRISVIILAVLLFAFGVNAAFEKTNVYKDDFADVKSSAWYAENVKTAYELGFMNGKSAGKFDPNGNVTVAEGITMAARLHAIYNGTEITKDTTTAKNEIRFDFNDLNCVRFNHAVGEISDGVLVLRPDKPNQYGNYDPGVFLDALLVESRRYNRMKFRMKRDILPNTKPDLPRNEKMEIYFGTEIDPTFAEVRSYKPDLSEVGDMSEWFEYVVELDANDKWENMITSIRFDPTNNNGVYYIDYISLYEAENSANSKWYDMYVDYALANGIIIKAQFDNSEMSRNITRSEICDLFATALPEEYFNRINDIKGIPDVLRDSKNADTYLMLYNAGVLLGDTNGNFNANADIKRSEIAAIINRTALPESRVKGTVNADWKKQGNAYDIEFDTAELPSNITPTDVEDVKLVNGTLQIKALDRGEERKPRFDPKITVKNINVDAEEYSKLTVRMKVDFIGEVTNTSFDFYFTTDEDTNFSEAKSAHQDFRDFSYVDPAGWYVMEVDLSLSAGWNGNITSFRFDPANTNGVYTIDYIRLAKGDPLRGASHDVLINEGYTATRLMQDEGFERGFYIAKTDQTAGHLNHGIWKEYCETDEKPLWGIGPWWQGTGDGLTMVDLWEDRDTTTDKYTLADKYGVNTIKYNPEEKSVSMRLNATNIYHGQPHIKDDKSTPDVDEGNYKWWPHLLIEQSRTICPIDRKRNSADADRMFIELDAKITDFKATTNPEGANVCDFLAYFYLRTDKAPGQLIWFGIQIFSGANLNMPIGKTGWSPDSAAHQYMYGIRMNTLYDGMENSFNPEKGVALVGDDWKHIRLDVTKHIETAISWANRDNIFGVQVSKEDMYFDGVNIGYEIHGNYDCTVEFKNFNMVAYND